MAKERWRSQGANPAIDAPALVSNVVLCSSHVKDGYFLLWPSSRPVDRKPSHNVSIVVRLHLPRLEAATSHLVHYDYIGNYLVDSVQVVQASFSFVIH